MKEKLQKLPLAQLIATVQRFRFIIFVSLFAGIYAYLLVFIGSLNDQNPPQSAINDQLKTVKKLNIDENSVQQMLLLTEEHIEIKALYNDARNNPFAE